MPTQLLALAVALGSFSFYMAAFFFPEAHRRHDFFWSGVGLFYALVLWLCAAQITGAVLLGQTASVALLIWLGSQTLTLRRAQTPLELQTPATAAAWRSFWQQLRTLTARFLQRTPLGRWVPAPTADVAAPPPVRAAPVREVGYEFVGDIQEEVRASRFPTPPVAPRPVARLPQATAAAKPTGLTLWQRGVILKDWVGEVWQASRRPKAPRPVIEIPPRERAAEATDEPPEAADTADSTASELT